MNTEISYIAMAIPLTDIRDELVRGTLKDRPNRFVLRVEFPNGEVESVFLGDPGALRNLVEEGNRVVCRPVDDPSRKTAYDAIAIDTGDVLVSVRAAYANELFAAILEKDLYPPLDGYTSITREPALPDHGRADFLVETTEGDEVWVEVKSCTHVEDGVVKFPDRPTERGRRHLRSLRDATDDSMSAHVVFVVQHPSAEEFRPYRDVDPEFADLLEAVSEDGVTLHAVVASFDPPEYVLLNDDLPIHLNE